MHKNYQRRRGTMKRPDSGTVGLLRTLLSTFPPHWCTTSLFTC